MGCAFDVFSSSWSDRSYVLTLFVLCWCIPVLIICTSYIGIIYRVKHSDIKSMLPKNIPCGILRSNSVAVRSLVGNRTPKPSTTSTESEHQRATKRVDKNSTEK